MFRASPTNPDLLAPKKNEGLRRLRSTVAADRMDPGAPISTADGLLSVEANETLEHAVRVMFNHKVNCVVVVEPGTMTPVGTLSTLGMVGVRRVGEEEDDVEEREPHAG
jgi:CBS domain-containing protein